MTTWDLSVGNNWDLILTESRIATQRTEPTFSKYFHNPIPPIFASPSSNLLLVGARSNSAKPHWYLGAIASQFLYVSPNLIDYKISGVQTGISRRIGLDMLTLVEFKDYAVSPYVVQLTIPRWIEDISIQVWENNLLASNDTEDILNRIDALAVEIEALKGLLGTNENYGI